jgi:hypothetical protein
MRSKAYPFQTENSKRDDTTKDLHFSGLLHCATTQKSESLNIITVKTPKHANNENSARAAA